MLIGPTGTGTVLACDDVMTCVNYFTLSRWAILRENYAHFFLNVLYGLNKGKLCLFFLERLSMGDFKGKLCPFFLNVPYGLNKGKQCPFFFASLLCPRLPIMQFPALRIARPVSFPGHRIAPLEPHIQGEIMVFF